MNKVISKLTFPLLMFVLALAVRDVEAAVIIDDFADSQEAINVTSSPMSIVGVDASLGVVSRTLISSSAGTSIAVEDGYLGVSNDINGAGFASISYGFSGVDLSGLANALQVNVDFVNGNFGLQVLANGGASEFTLDNLLEGQLLIAFSDFTNPLVFSALTSLEFKFSGDNGTDLTLFRNIAAVRQPSSVPEPTVLALLVIGLLAIAHKGRKRAAVLV